MRKIIIRTWHFLCDFLENGGIRSCDPEVNRLADGLRDREFGFHASSQ